MFRRHFVANCWIWLLIAVVVVTANELVDRNFFDHRQHVDGDFVITLGVVLIAFFVPYAVAGRKRPTTR
jgi:hypothetical protein